jgi:hypothetical protein
MYLGLYEREIHPWLRGMAGGVRTAVDVGASEGSYTLYFLLKTSATQVFAFEPLAESRDWLTRNLRLNELTADPRCVVSSKLVGRCDTEDECTLDDMSPMLEPPCLVKVDVEGAEGDVLAGATTLLKRRDVSWLMEVHSAELERECRTRFAAAGLRTTLVKNAWWRFALPELRPLEVNRWLVASA